MGRLPNGKYYNRSIRWKDCNYSENGAYFITINTYQRKSFFGHIEKGKMCLSEIGKIARDEWLRTSEIRPNLNLYMDDFVVMPNHFHGIIVIRRKCAMHGAYTFVPTSSNGTRFGPQSNNIPSIIRGFKSAVTIRARKISPCFKWFPRYYDHVIRDQDEYIAFKNYILQNPLRYMKSP